MVPDWYTHTASSELMTLLEVMNRDEMGWPAQLSGPSSVNCAGVTGACVGVGRSSSMGTYVPPPHPLAWVTSLCALNSPHPTVKAECTGATDRWGGGGAAL